MAPSLPIISIEMFFARLNAADSATLKQLVDYGKLKLEVVCIFPLAELDATLIIVKNGGLPVNSN
jgi:hypothetical protein